MNLKKRESNLELGIRGGERTAKIAGKRLSYWLGYFIEGSFFAFKGSVNYIFNQRRSWNFYVITFYYFSPYNTAVRRSPNFRVPILMVTYVTLVWSLWLPWSLATYFTDSGYSYWLPFFIAFKHPSRYSFASLGPLDDGNALPPIALFRLPSMLGRPS